MSVYNDNLETTLGQLKDNCETKSDLGTTIGETTFRRNVLWASYDYLFFYFLAVQESWMSDVILSLTEV